MKTTKKYIYPKTEKLKKKKVIDFLFSEGKYVSNHPLRLVYVKLENSDTPIQIGVSVSKRFFKKAVDRNYFKRVLREVYRLNKYLLIENLDAPYAMMLFYQTKSKLSYQEINEKAIELFAKFKDKIKENNLEK